MALPCAAQTWEWGNALQAVNNTTIIVQRGIDADLAGNTYVTGYFNGTMNTASGTVTSNGDDVFVAKFSPTGSLLYVITGGGGGNDRAMGIAYETVGTGAFYITGSVEFHDLAWNVTFQGVSSSLNMAPTTACSYDSLNIGSGPSSSQIFVAKFTAAGAPVWARAVYSYLSRQSPLAQSSEGLAITASYRHISGKSFERNVYVTGYFRGGICTFPKANCGFINVSGNSANETAFVAKLNGTTGFAMWAKSLYNGNSWSNSIGMGISSDIMNTTGNVYITGNFSGGVNLKTNMAAATTNKCSYVARLSGSTGACAWQTQVYAPGASAYVKDLTCSVDNYQVYITGDHNGSTLRVPGSGIIGAGTSGSDVYLARFNAQTGGLDWLTSEDDPYLQKASSIDFSQNGAHVYATGYFETQFHLNSGIQLNTTRPGIFEEDHYLAKYDATNGQSICASRYDAGSIDHPYYGTTILFASDVKTSRTADHVYMSGVYYDTEQPQISGVPAANSTTNVYVGKHTCCDCPPASILQVMRDPVGMTTATNATVLLNTNGCIGSVQQLRYTNMLTGATNIVPIPPGATSVFVNGLDATATYSWMVMAACGTGNMVMKQAQESSGSETTTVLFPNPASTSCSFAVESAELAGPHSLTLVDAAGREVRNVRADEATDLDGTAVRIDVTGLTPGMYLVSWTSATRSIAMKLRVVAP